MFTKAHIKCLSDTCHFRSDYFLERLAFLIGATQAALLSHRYGRDGTLGGRVVYLAILFDRDSAVQSWHIDVEFVIALDRFKGHLGGVLAFLQVHLLEEVLHFLGLLFFDFDHLIKAHKRRVEARIVDGVLAEDEFNSRLESELIEAEVTQESRHREVDDV